MRGGRTMVEGLGGAQYEKEMEAEDISGMKKNCTRETGSEYGRG